jgi:hypothetical protein
MYTVREASSSFIHADVQETFRSLGIALDDAELVARANELIAPVTVADLLSPPADGVVFGRAWKTFLDNRRVPDEETWDRPVLLLLGVFRSAFERGMPWERTLHRFLSTSTATSSGRPMSLSGCYFESRRSMASREFHYGRRGTITPEKVASLQACLRDFDFLLTVDAARTNPYVRRRYLGMRGVTSVFLGRSQAQPELFVRAIADLQESGPLGDSSPQRSEYLAEAWLCHYETSRDIAELHAASAVLDEARGRGLRTRALSSLRGTVASALADRLSEQGDSKKAIALLESSMAAFTEGLELPPHQAHAEPYLRLNRAAAAVRWTYMIDAPAREEAVLERAIDDLRHVERENNASFRNLWLPAALVARAELRHRRNELQGSLVDAREALDRAVAAGEVQGAEGLRERAKYGVANTELAVSVAAEDLKETARQLEWWIREPAPENVVSVPVLSNALRFLVSRDHPKWHEYVHPVVAMFRRVAAQPGHSGPARRFALGHAASLTLLLAKARKDVALYREAYALYVDAIDAAEEPAAPELYGHAGEVALRLARSELAEGHDAAAVPLLRDAADFMEHAFARHSSGVAFSEKIPVKAVHSRAGEAYARLHGLTGDDPDAAEAIRHLQKAHELGNTTPELFGLVGDVYFRRGRARRDVEDLRAAVQWKNRARASAGAGDAVSLRENLSVTANAALQIWSITHSAADLTTAIRAAADAAQTAPTWAWPVMQLGEASRAPERERGIARQHLGERATEPLVAMTLNGEADKLLHEACRIAVENRVGFHRDFNYSGRSKVYTIDDPHRLLSTTLIVKETPKDNAEREVTTIRAFRDYLSATEAPAWMRLPEPLTTIESARNTAYVMRRESGIELGIAVLRSSDPAAAMNVLLDRAVRFLARFHAWRGVGSGLVAAASLSDAIRDSVKELASLCNVPREERLRVAEILRAALHAELPTVAKKDAHAENWLVTRHQSVVMLDLEATESARFPVLYEVAQLMEDQGLLPPDAAGWTGRHALMTAYLGDLAALSGNETLLRLDRALLERSYAAFALIRAALLIPGAGGRAIRRRTQSSVIRARMHRADHYRQLVEAIRQRFRGSPVSDVAAALSGWLQAC